MGAGNVKAPRTEPLPLRLGANDVARASYTSAAPVSKSHEDDAHISGVASPSHKKWDVTLNIHRGIICRFCGGKSCKREDYTKQADTPAIHGLHSTWISANVLAMQRPSTRLIKQYGIIEQFRKANVGAVINLQLSGEHPHCGDGIGPSGFSYRAEDFTDAGHVHVYNPGWVDMNIPSLEKMLEIVQIMQFHTDKLQKVAVHCHAGFGRTGIVIACFFVYAYGLSAEMAIKSVRDRRSGCVQTAKQKRFVYDFAEYVVYLRTVFYAPTLTSFAQKHANRPPGSPAAAAAIAAAEGHHSSDDENILDEDSQMHSHNSAHATAPSPMHGGVGGLGGAAAGGGGGFPGMVLSRKHTHLLGLVLAEREASMANRYTLHESLSRQRAILHGPERSSLKFMPKILSVLMERLIDLSEHRPALLAAAFLDGFRRSSTLTRLFDEERDREKERRRIKNKEGRNAAALASKIGPSVAQLVVPNLARSGSSHGRGTPSPNPLQTRGGSPHAGGGGGSLLHPHDDGGLASLSVHGNIAHSHLWELGGHGHGSHSRTQAAAQLEGLAHGHGSIASIDKSDSDLSSPKWSLIQDDQYAALKKKINAGEWTALESCDIRYVAQLLLEWLEALRIPMLPLFERGHGAHSGGGGSQTTPRAVLVSSLFAHPNIIAISPVTFFGTLPRWTLHALDPVMRMLYNMRNLELSALARVYARFAFALTQPRAQIPDALVVYQTPAMRAAQALGHKIATAGLSLQVLHQAAQASLLQQNASNNNSMPASSVSSSGSSVAPVQRTVVVGGLANGVRPLSQVGGAVGVGSAAPNFDAFHCMLPANKSLLDSLVEFLASFTRSWGTCYSKLLADEERMAVHNRVGVRKVLLVEESVAQQHPDEGLMQTQLRPYQAEATKLAVASQLGDDDRKPARRAQTDHTTFDPASRNISQTAYLHSHIHHTQPAMAHNHKNQSLLSSPAAGTATNPNGLSPQAASGRFLTPMASERDLDVSKRPYGGDRDRDLMSQTGLGAWPHSRFVPGGGDAPGAGAADGGLRLEEREEDGGVDGLLNAGLYETSMIYAASGFDAGTGLGTIRGTPLPAGLGDEEKERLGGFITQRQRSGVREAGARSDGGESNSAQTSPAHGARPERSFLYSANDQGLYRDDELPTAGALLKPTPLRCDSSSSLALFPPMHARNDSNVSALPSPLPVASPDSQSRSRLPVIDNSPYVPSRVVLTKNPAAQVELPPISTAAANLES